MILMLNRTEFVESVLAANMLGAIAVPLNFRLTAAEIAFLVDDCEARVMITEPVLAPVATGVRDIQPLLDTIIVAGGRPDDDCSATRTWSTSAGDPPEPVDIPNDSPALIMYTSGTTGRPKGAVLTHTNLTGQTMTASTPSAPTSTTTSASSESRCSTSPASATCSSGLLLGVPTVIYPLGAFEPGPAARRAGRREGHRHLPGPRAVAGGLRRAAGPTP